MGLSKNIIVSVLVVGITVGGTITGYAVNQNDKLEKYHQEKILVEQQVSNLILGNSKEGYINLINKYDSFIGNKEFKKASEVKSQIDELIISIEKDNVLFLQNKINEFKQLNIDKLDDVVKNDIQMKLDLIEGLISKKDFKTASSEIESIMADTKEKIQVILDEEKRMEEEIKKSEELKKEELENSINGSSEQVSGSNSNGSSEDSSQDSAGDNKYKPGSVEGLIASSPTAQYTNQIIGVVANGSSAEVYLLEKNNDTWRVVLQTSGFVGSQGVGQASEYVSRTPKGSYSLGFAFGTGANPGTNLEYRQITKDSYWISDVNNPLYNTWQEGDFGGGVNEHLIDYPTQYQYGITLNYNGGVGGGSAFFLHCSNGIPTAGCISVPSNIMLTFMQSIGMGAYIINVNSVDELAKY